MPDTGGILQLNVRATVSAVSALKDVAEGIFQRPAKRLYIANGFFDFPNISMGQPQ